MAAGGTEIPLAAHGKTSRYGEIYKARVWEDLRTLFQQDHLTDIMLAADGRSIPCHRVLLAAASQFFHEKFVTNPESLDHNLLDIEGIEFNTLASVVSFIYSGDIELTPEKALKLCPASIKLMLPELTGVCEDFLLDQTKLGDPDVSFIDINKMAKQNSMEELANISWQVMLSEFPEVIETEAFKEMSEAELEEYITDDGLNIANEDPVFEALVIWVGHDVENRTSSFESLLKYVSLSHCSLEFLDHSVRREPLMMSMGCYKHLAEALFQHARVKALQPGTPRKGYTGKYSQPNSLIAVCEDRCWVLQDGEHFWVRQRFTSPRKPEFSRVCMAVKGIVFTGGRLNCKPSKQCWKISLRTMEWVRLPDLNVARLQHASVCVGHQVYVLGGKDCDGKPLQSVEYLDDKAGEWCVTSDIPVHLFGHTAVNYNNYIYLFGYRPHNTATDFSNESGKTFALDVASNTWTKKADMPAQCRGAYPLSCLHRNTIYLYDRIFNYSVTYDPDQDQWGTLSRPGYAMYSACCAWKDRILLHGGMYGLDGVIQQYNPDSNTWSAWEHQLPKLARRPVALFAVHLSKRAMRLFKQKISGQTMMGDSDDVICSIHTLYDN